MRASDKTIEAVHRMPLLSFFGYCQGLVVNFCKVLVRDQILTVGDLVRLGPKNLESKYHVPRAIMSRMREVFRRARVPFSEDERRRVTGEKKK